MSDLLQCHRTCGGLPEFLRPDSEGRLIPDYLADLAKHLARQRQAAPLELDLLGRNIEHIKKTVSMQQNYARITGLAEPLTPDLLVEDALRMTLCDPLKEGIPGENLTRIFGHGFTTRKDGHGFGLHSAALAAKEMGGRLFAESGGLSHGATFTLELPVAQMEAAA